MATATGQVVASSLLLIPVMLIVDRPWTLAAPGMAAILALIGVAVLSTVLAFIIYFRILSTAGATNLMLVTFLIPVSAIILGILLLGETLHPKQIAGMLMIGAGLALIDGRPLRALVRAISTKPSS
jgi:drug/metabolite transporter (DMT)-like permease